MKSKLAFLVAYLITAPHSDAASFDCARARSPVEKMICSNEQLSSLDEHLGRYFQGALHVLAPARACLRADQQQWLQRRNRCTDESCLAELYLARLAELDGLQPGANAVKDVELPAAATLEWIVPPAEDEIAAPRSGARETQTLTGTIANRIEDGGDIEIVTADDEHVPLTMLMTADEASIDRLSALARTQDRYRARGVLAVDDDGARHFDPSQCVFVHREHGAP